MIALWLAYAVLLGAVFAVVAVLLERLLRLWRLPVRGVWAAALVATLVAPLLFSAVRAPDEAAVPLASTLQPVTGLAVLPAMVVEPPSLGERLRARAGALSAVAAGRLAPLDRPLLLLWAGASLLLLLSLARSAHQLRHRRRGWAQQVVDGEAVLVAPDTGPAVIGSAAPAVVLPAWALELDAPLRRLVLQHETEHLRAGDPQLLLAGVAAAVLAPWNPALWWQLGRLRLAVELDCDRRVLRAHRDVERYGLLLMAVGQRTSGLLRLATPALSEPTTSLERRIAAMTARPPRRRPLHAATLAAAAALVLAVACMAPGPNMVAGPETPVVTERAAPTMVDSNAIFFEFQVEKPVAQIPGQGNPTYPSKLQSEGVSGEAIVQFVVDTNGIAMPGTFKVLASSHEMFTQSVKNALPGMRFTPAEVGGRRVKQLVQQPFQFGIAVPLRSDSVSMRETSPADVRVLSPMRVPLRASDSVRRANVPVDENNTTYFEFQVEKPAAQIPGHGNPTYPSKLQSEGVTGEVIAQFVVNPDGLVDVATFKTLASSHEMFTQAIRNALPRMRFRPAEIGGRRVKQLVQQPFQFNIGG